jgi:hypothetical protein
MPGDDEDDFDYTETDLHPREPDRFEKRGDPYSESGDERRPADGREIREHK